MYSYTYLERINNKLNITNFYNFLIYDIIFTNMKKILLSPTLNLSARISELEEKGKKVLNLTAGETSFPTSNYIKKAIIDALKNNYTYYSDVSGIIDLRKAICSKLKKENSINYKPNEIIITAGAKQALYEAISVICNHGDEVIIPTPTWSTYVEQVKIANSHPVFIKLKPPFKLRYTDIENKITRKTKAIILNSPANPTGSVIDKNELEKIANLAIKHKIYIISDEVYEKLIFGKKHCSIASFRSKIKNLTITINSFSKSYSLTGLRIGYAAGSKNIISKMAALQSQITSNACSLSQYAALAALTNKNTDKYTHQIIDKIYYLRNLAIEKLSQIPNISYTKPEGTFYIFLNLKKVLSKKYSTSHDWVEGLLLKKQVAIVPGEAFLAPGYARLNFAKNEQVLREALKKIGDFVNVQT